ncbi:MAG: ATP-binding protein [Clostridia bacterium]|nr:ATP-binding protein [Clostridia bacterium]
MSQSTLKNLYARIRAEELRAQAARVEEAYARAPRLAALDEERRQVLLDVGSRACTPPAGAARLEQLYAEETQILHALGLPGDYLKLRERCPLCHDTGFTGQDRKAPCACYLGYREAQKGESGINARETFENFDEDIYPDALQKKRSGNARKLCEAYAAALPRPEKPNLLILGMPGLGKSYLGNAIAHAAIRRGLDALRVTAYRFVQDVMADIRENRQNARRYQNVPLLVLDDLGSEPVIPNVSVEWLFAVVNERSLAGRASVCITNLQLAELQARYGERLMSRLCDKNTTQVLQLAGKNLRV